MRGRLSIAVSVLAALLWAVPVIGAAHSFSSAPTVTSQVIKFRVDRDRGLIVEGWLNGRGPFIFVIDTGAGMNLVSRQLVNAAGLSTSASRPAMIGGLSRSVVSSTRQAIITSLAVGTPGSVVATNKTAVVVESLPPGVDGILDPAHTFDSTAFLIDMPRRTLEITNTPQLNDLGSEGALVEWLASDASDRPFVKLGDGRIALIDTGSRFGLAVNSRQAIVLENRSSKGGRVVPTIDVGGGTIIARRVAPTTISIGELVLRGIPTDILSGISDDAPLILGRDALLPFRITFDTQRRLIAFAASERQRAAR
ncbi:MAG TPA: retropepsin-like aspartic protease [Pyrinomonadaceae bacterium]|nr:retropepsin-like aspartic protease [Pyrinomonadaceae bacterium]